MHCSTVDHFAWVGKDCCCLAVWGQKHPRPSTSSSDLMIWGRWYFTVHHAHPAVAHPAHHSLHYVPFKVSAEFDCAWNLVEKQKLAKIVGELHSHWGDSGDSGSVSFCAWMSSHGRVFLLTAEESSLVASSLAFDTSELLFLSVWAWWTAAVCLVWP